MKKQPESTVLVRYGNAVRKRRQELGISQEQLADRAGIHRTYVGDVERGERNLSLTNIERIARALEITVSDLFRLYEIETAR